MGMRCVLVLTLATVCWAGGAQSASTVPEATPSGPQVAAASLAPGTSESLHGLSVVVEDKDGHPVRGLKAQNFRITEGRVPQTIDHLVEHSSLHAPPTPPGSLSLPPGTFANYTPLAPGETLNILLIDALNTPVKGESFVRSELLQYVREANPNRRIAILGLANRLTLLQGFASDPTALRDVIERKLIARMPASEDPSRSSSTSAATSPLVNQSHEAINVAANLRAFEGALDSLESSFRVPYTLDAFNTLAHYLAAFPGRKNLIWFSASFPFNPIPDPSVPHPFRVEDADEEEFRETVALLSKAQVAVYPVDARGLLTRSAGRGISGGSASANHAHPYELGKLPEPPAAEHTMMDAIAESTGGRAFYNPESLADAVNSAVAAGSNYYNLTYNQTAADKNGLYEPMDVEVLGADAAQPVKLRYRRGALNEPSANSPGQNRAEAYAHAAMRRGGPAPEDLLFKVRVLPASTTTETALASNNQLDPDIPSKGPFRRYDLDFLLPSSELAFAPRPGGQRMAKVEFLAYVYDTVGDRLNASGQTVTIEPKQYDESRLARTLIRYHLEVSVPDRVETFLRVAVRDDTGNRFGIVEIPTSLVSFLPPAIYTPSAPANPKPAGR